MKGRLRRPGADRLAAALFWGSVLCLPLASVVVITTLAHALPGSELPSVSLVFGLSLVGTVVPIGVQARAAADTAIAGRSGRIAVVPATLATLGLAALSVPLALLIGVGIPAVVLPSLSLGPAIAVAAVRGDLIGRGDFGGAARNNLAEASIRLVAGIGLGLVWGADGVGASLLLCTLGAWLVAPRRAPGPDRLRLPATLAASTAILLSVNWGVIVAPQLLGDSAAAFAAAALPAMGVYMALAASAWIVVPHVRDHTSFASVVRPVVLVVTVGIVLAIVLIPAAPVVGALLDRPAPSIRLLVMLGPAMACASGIWVLLQLRLVRMAVRPWLPSCAGLGLTALLSLTLRTPSGLAAAILLGQLGGLIVGLVLLRMEVRSGPDPVGATSSPRPLDDPVALAVELGR